MTDLEDLEDIIDEYIYEFVKRVWLNDEEINKYKLQEESRKYAKIIIKEFKSTPYFKEA